ncbi:hypothetical protein BaRGS_00015134 [Batillaria attramentaria]|uniref:Uncharacterized protein n=1 Tax=Batillaria attramentaria TaxID=370345 RepID=A0ABD0L2J8_9CAEN
MTSELQKLSTELQRGMRPSDPPSRQPTKKERETIETLTRKTDSNISRARTQCNHSGTTRHDHSVTDRLPRNHERHAPTERGSTHPTQAHDWLPQRTLHKRTTG